MAGPRLGNTQIVANVGYHQWCDNGFRKEQRWRRHSYSYACSQFSKSYWCTMNVTAPDLVNGTAAGHRGDLQQPSRVSTRPRGWKRRIAKV